MRFAVLAVSLALVACSSKPNDNNAPPAQNFPAGKLAPKVVTASLSATTSTKGSSITLQKASLGKAFLLSMTLSDASASPAPRVLLPKVVTFELNGSEVGLLEQSTYSINNEIPSGKLLQSFPVESQDADTVTFKWLYGLVSVPTKGFYVSSDNADSAKAEVSETETVLPVSASYLKFARISENRLELRQVMRVRSVVPKGDSDDTDTTKEESVQLDVAITPYVPNPRFQLRLSSKLQGVGFFEIASVRKNEGPLDVLASHWDLSPEAGPITYAISKTAPPEAVDAMKEGLQYWNNVSQATLGRDIIKIETGADPAAPPRPRTVIVYWVPYANAGSAFANFQPDPLTGEISSGFVYQTSVFFLSGRNRGRRYVDRGVENSTQFTPTGFRAAAICEFPEPSFLGKDPLIPDDMDEKIGQKMGLDYLRFVVAHETGHTLGLRHNFAGSLGSEVANPQEAREKFRAYLTDEHNQGAVTSSTVMDYVTFRDVILQGASIGAKKTFPYDKAAITWAYGDKPISAQDLNAPYYCADTEGNGLHVLGCATGDTGPHPLTGHAWEFARTRQLAPDVVVETITDAIRPDNPSDSLTVKEALAANHPDSLSITLAAEALNVMRVGGPGMKVMQIDRAEEGPNWANKQEYKEKTAAFIAAEFAGLGGLPGILKIALDLDDNYHSKAGWLVASVEERTARSGFGTGKTTYGKAYQLTAAEMKDVKAAAEKLGAATESAFLRDTLLSVTGLVPKDVTGGAGKGTLKAYMDYGDKLKIFEPTVVQDDWQPGLGSLAEQLALETGDSLSGTVDGAAVTVPVPSFTLEERVAAMRLYSAKVFSRTSDTWLKDSSDKVAKGMLDRLAPVFKIPDGDPDKAVPAGKLSKELVAWGKQELAVLKALRTAR